MNPFSRRGRMALLAAVLAVPVPAWALKATVVDRQGNPIEKARVCYIVDKIELICVNTDREGRFELPTSEVDTLRATAPGYLRTEFSGAGLRGPVVMERSPSLLVRLVDKSDGSQLSEGEVFIVYPSGREQGPFPANAAGVRIRRLLQRGEVRVIGKAEGYRDSEPRPVTLVAGEEEQIVLELEPSD